MKEQTFSLYIYTLYALGTIPFELLGLHVSLAHHLRPVMALGFTHKVAHTLENRYKKNMEKMNSIIMNYVKYMRVHILTDRTSLTIPSPLNKHEMWHYYVPDFT